MKFKFPLQKVLEHRKLLENIVQKDFQEALAELLGLRNRLLEMEAQADDARVRAFQLQNDGGHAGAGLSQVNDFLNNQKILTQMQMVRISQQEKFVEEKRELLRQAAVETKAIATFKERKFEEFQKQENLDEQKEMDELSVLRFVPREKK